MSDTREITAEEARLTGMRLGLDWTRIDLEPLRRGLEVELEHGARDPETNAPNDDLIRKGKVAWAHLKEIRDYPPRLDQLEADAQA